MVQSLPTISRAPCRRARRLTLGLGLALALGSVAAGAQPGGPLPQPLPLFPADNWWNLDVRAAPVDPRSAEILAFIGDDPLHPDFGAEGEASPEIYGMVWISVPGTQPLVPVTFVEYGDESDDGAPGRPPGYPIPEAAKTQPRWIEGGQPGDADADGDRHLLLVDRDDRVLYELYHARWNVARGRWEAGSGAVFPLDENRRRPQGWTSADAAGLAILPGLVRYDEVFGPDPIRHALRFTVRATDGHVWPASHTAGDTPGAPPMGTRLRLRASKDISGFPPAVRKIFQAMKTHGLLLADNGSDMYVSGAYDPRWDNDVLNPAFRALRASDFEVIELGWRPGASPTVPDAPSGVVAAALSPRRVRVRWSDVAGESAYHLEMKRGARGAWREVAVLGAGKVVRELGGLRPRARYAFRVRARNAAGFSPYSAIARVRLLRRGAG